LEEAITTLTRSSELLGVEDSWESLFLSMAHWQLGNKAVAVNQYNKAIRQMQRDNIDIHSLLTTTLHDLYLEAAELMGIKTKELYRKAPLTGKQILPVMARADNSRSNITEEHIVDGAGLADGDGDGLLEHDQNPENMWLSGEGPTIGWVEFDLGDVYELGSILLWNYNVKDHTKLGVNRTDISVWTPEAGWQKIFDDFGFTEAEGSFEYDEPILVRFDGVKAQRVRFDDLANFSDEQYVGLSEVQFFRRRGPEAIRPYPVDGSEIAVPKEAKLSWTPGVDVKAHKVYFGIDVDRLKYMGRFDVADSSEVKLSTLEKRQRYWWRVDAEKSYGSMIKGKLWSFSTGRMVGWWKFDETEGQIAVDSSGSGPDGKLVGDAHIISDPVRGNVLSLDGDGDYVYCGHNPAFDLTDEITVAAWINITTVPTSWTAIVTKGDSAWRLSTVLDERRFHFAITPGGAGASIDGYIEVPTNQWHHVCGTYDGSYVRLYVDGVEDSESPVSYGGTINTNAWEVLIGVNTKLPKHSWNGLIDDVRIYSYALSEDEIKALSCQDWIDVGSILHDETTDTYTMVGSGKDIWLNSDEFHFAYKKLDGDGTITARIDSVEHTHDWAKAGIMIRDTLAPDSAFADLVITPQNRICFQYRPAKGQFANSIQTDPNAVTLPHWVRLIRDGNKFRAQHSDDGNQWQDLESTKSNAPGEGEFQVIIPEILMNKTAYIGLAVTSHSIASVTATARISNVSVTGNYRPEGEFTRSENIGYHLIALPKK
jgi:hypothetical protein